MDEPQALGEEIKRLFARLPEGDRLALLEEMRRKAEGEKRPFDEASGDGRDSLEKMWRKLSRPIGKWSREDLHVRG